MSIEISRRIYLGIWFQKVRFLHGRKAQQQAAGMVEQGRMLNHEQEPEAGREQPG